MHRGVGGGHAHTRRAATLALWAVGLAACAADPPRQPAPSLTRAQLLDPLTCQGCHADHYREWASSMHAYAGEDPVFLALNARGQRETGGALGDFCVKCHAPMAVREGFTRDGLNLAEVPPHLRGVTCYFCHNVSGIEGSEDSNNPLLLADDRTMRGGIDDPVPTRAHRSRYSPLHDGGRAESARMCGSCHDIVNGHGVRLERTFQEWLGTVYNRERGLQTCASCHMTSVRDVVIAEETGLQTPKRWRHEHLFPGVDLALTDFPGVDVQRAAIECELQATVLAQLTVRPSNEVLVSLETDAGHRWPSGAAQDRRAWVEVVARREGEVVFQSGVVADGEWVDKPPDREGYDPALWQLRDRVFDASGAPTHMFWDVAPSVAYPEGVESLLLPGPPPDGAPHSLTRTYRLPVAADEITLAVHIRPVGLDVIDDLIDSGDLDPAVRERVPTFTLALTRLRWSLAEDGYGTVTNRDSSPFDCPSHYRDR